MLRSRRAAWVGGAVFVGTTMAGLVVLLSARESIEVQACEPPSIAPDAVPKVRVYACGRHPRILVAVDDMGMQAALKGFVSYRESADCINLPRAKAAVWPAGSRPASQGDRVGVEVPRLGILWEEQEWTNGGGGLPLSMIEGLSPDEPCIDRGAPANSGVMILAAILDP
jgi:hypothetical protein